VALPFLDCVIVEEEAMFETKGRPTWNELPWWTKAAVIIGPIAGALVILLHFLNRWRLVPSSFRLRDLPGVRRRIAEHS